MSELSAYRQQLQDQLQSQMQAEFRRQLQEVKGDVPKRSVVSLVKIRLAGCSNIDIDSATSKCSFVV